jgi:hypothetical protein
MVDKQQICYVFFQQTVGILMGINSVRDRLRTGDSAETIIY